jgi:hypothetical protein
MNVNHDDKEQSIINFTQCEWVLTGPCPAFAAYSLKNWGTEMPMNTEKPRMKLLLESFMFTN